MTDDETRRLLRSSDPAASLPSVAPDRYAELLEEAMTENQQPAGNRPRIVGGVLAAAAVAAAVLIGVNVLGDDDPGKPATAEPKQTVTALTATGGGDAKCMAPDARIAARQDVAFEGTVTTIEDGVVTLRATTFWTDNATDLVTVTEPDLNSSEMPVDFVVGQDYIVGATDGSVSICGLAGLATDDLRALYDEAFGPAAG